jgi:flagellar biosynthesis protein FlhB
MSDEKTEEPTQKKLDDARKKGQVPQRKIVLEAILMIAGLGMVMALWRPFADETARVIDLGFQAITDGPDSVGNAVGDTISNVMLLSVAASGGLGFLTLFMNLMLNKFNFAPAAMEPKFDKLNPVNGLKGIFSMQTLYNFGRMLIYFSFVGVLLYVTIRSNIVDVVHAAACGLTCLADLFPNMILQMVIMILLVLILMAAADFKLQNAMFRKQNKMSKEEVKREHKGSEGDPMIKGQRRALAEEDAFMPSPKDVTHVVYGSNHLVAMIYTPGQTPFVVVKGKGPAVARMQQRFRSMGTKCVNIPVVAQEFHGRYPVGRHMDARAAKGMAKVLRATGEM